nr:CDP-glycerol glycerophosphotransferase family protein [Acinetobacter defluvii]
MSYLSCYIPYNHDVGVFGGIVNQHNQLFHNAQWVIFTPHQCSYTIYQRFSAAKGRNVVVTGYPPMEPFFCNHDVERKSSWNNFDSRKRVIWAPHHTIDMEYLPFSNFLIYADDMLKLAKKYSNKIFWSFKPHPELKYKLYKHHEWGVKKTDLYYKHWEDSDFSQLDQGEYINLFIESDAMIHDCGSFLAEYMYVKKPVLYMLNINNGSSYYNSFGNKALKACRVGNNKEDIECFIQNLLVKDFFITDEHRIFYETEIFKYFNGTTPSLKIINILKNKIGERQK